MSASPPIGSTTGAARVADTPAPAVDETASIVTRSQERLKIASRPMPVVPTSVSGHHAWGSISGSADAASGAADARSAGEKSPQAETARTQRIEKNRTRAQHHRRQSARIQRGAARSGVRLLGHSHGGSKGRRRAGVTPPQEYEGARVDASRQIDRPELDAGGSVVRGEVERVPDAGEPPRIRAGAPRVEVRDHVCAGRRPVGRPEFPAVDSV